jgi:hypothetical protein
MKATISTSKTLDILKFSLGKETFSISVKELLSIDEENLDQEAVDVVNFHGHVGMIKARLGRKLSDLEMQQRNLSASIWLDAKEDKSLARPSNEFCNNIVEEDTSYIEITKKVSEAKEQFFAVSSLLESMKLKASIIQTLAANNRV